MNVNPLLLIRVFGRSFRICMYGLQIRRWAILWLPTRI